MTTETKIAAADITLYAAGNGAYPVGVEITDADDRVALLAEYRSTGAMRTALLVDPADYGDDDLTDLGPSIDEIDWSDFRAAGAANLGNGDSNGKWLADGRFGYYDTASRGWWIVDAEDLEVLGAMLARDEPDAYSFWCSRTHATEVQDDDAERVELTGHVHCQCARVTGSHSCREFAAAADMVTVETMPEQHRASHLAAGNAGTYPANGAVRVRCAKACAEALVEGDEDGWTTIVATTAA